jgi:hypothetical protein
MCSNKAGLRNLIRIFVLFFLLCAVTGLIVLFVYFGEGLNKKVGQNEYAVVQNKYSTKLKGPMDQGVQAALERLLALHAIVVFLTFAAESRRATPVVTIAVGACI